MGHILESISPDEAWRLLRLLADSDKVIEAKIVEFAEEMIIPTRFEDISDDVFYALDEIDVHDLWDQSGASRGEYRSTEEIAFEMIEEALEVFKGEIFRLIKIGYVEDATRFCKQVLKGLYKYDADSKSEFKAWAPDIPYECFHEILSEWEKQAGTASDMEEMTMFLSKECKKWIKQHPIQP